MANEYLDNEDLVVKFEKIDLSKTMEALKQKFQAQKTTPKRTIAQSTDLRDQTAKLLKRPLLQVCKLTQNWSVENLYITLHTAEQFINPPALWWVLYKKNKEIYGRKKTNNTAVPGMGIKRGIKNKKVRQETLF